ncbi:MAG: cysteine synthase A [Candidatus Adiutrix sp.]|jgi:cysteine synthase A|nr:cysteine synthase A [Candidatus Adiutrix sp.]
MALYADNPQSIGNTPLVRLNRIVSAQATVLAKIEGRNPAYSVKCRVGAALIRDAEERGVLKPGAKIVEPTSGNTGIALAMAAAAKGYELIITMPETMSLERRQVMAMLGAKLVLTPGAEGMAGAIKRAEEIVASEPGAFMPGQFTNPANPAVHAATTGPEIWQDTKGKVDVFIAAVGTGGTISGTGSFLKSQKAGLKVVAVEPAGSPVISQHLAGQPLKPGPHKIQGIGAGFIPATLNLSVIDTVETVSDDDAITFARRLAAEEGILAGISSGAAAAVAARLSARPEFAGQTLAVILPDAGERYLSSVLYENIGV